MIKRSVLATAVAAIALAVASPVASAADVQVGPWTVQVPDIAPVLIPVPMGSEAGALPPLPFPFVWDAPSFLAPLPAPGPAVDQPPVQAPAVTYVSNCTEARQLGIAPMDRSHPAYRPALDRNNDGIACED